jgi:hypothetical protein
MTGDLVNVPGPGAYNPPLSSFAPFYSGVLQSVARRSHVIQSAPLKFRAPSLKCVAVCCRVLHQGVVPTIRPFLVLCPSTLVGCSVLHQDVVSYSPPLPMKESCRTICLFLVYCSVLQCVAVCCSVLHQGVTTYNVPLSHFTPFYSSMLQYVAVCCTKESYHTIRLFLVLRPSTLVFCSVLRQGVVPTIRLSQGFAPFYSSFLKCLAVSCSVLQCVKSRSHVIPSVTL